MNRQVEIKKEVLKTVIENENVCVREYWVARGVRTTRDVKTVVFEKEYDEQPTFDEIAKLCYERQCDVDFFSVEHNYAYVKEDDLPFA